MQSCTVKFDNENSRCVSAGPEPDARVCVILRGEEVEIELKGRSMDLVKMAATALMERDSDPEEAENGKPKQS